MKRACSIFQLAFATFFGFAITGYRLLGVPDQELDGWQISTEVRTRADGKPEERILVSRGTKSKFAWASDWSRLALTGRYARPGSGVSPDEVMADITGDGVPKLYVWVAEDLEHHLDSFTALRLGSSVSVIGTMPATPGDGPAVQTEPKPQSNRGILLVPQFTPFTGKSRLEGLLHPVYVRWTNGQFRVAEEFMRKRPPNAKHLTAQVRRLRAAFTANDQKALNDQGEPKDLWIEAADYAWSGHPDIAADLIARAWPPDRAGMKKRREDFFNELAQNVWYPKPASSPPPGSPPK